MKKIFQLIQQLSRKHGNLRLLQDFIEICSIDIEAPFKNRQERRISLCQHYLPEELNLMQQLLAEIVKELTRQPRDILGEIYMELNVANKQLGQCFTPRAIGQILAGLRHSPEKIRQIIDTQGYYQLYEPTCGSGMLIIEFIEEFKRLGFNPHYELMVYAEDLDVKCVFMTHLQLSLLGVPALVAHGDPLERQQFNCHATPFYYFQRARFTGASNDDTH